MAITRIRLDIPFDPETLASYEARAAERGVNFETAVSDHLYHTQTVPEGQLIVLGESEIAEVKRLLGAKISTAKKLLDMLRRLTGWKVGGMQIKLTPNQQEQIVWYARSAGKPVEEIAPMLIERAITRELKTR